jgi:hypothetical protein
LKSFPKLDLHREVAAMNRRALLNMLSITKQLPIQLNDKTISNFEKINLADVLANLFISELYKAVKLYLDYHVCPFWFSISMVFIWRVAAIHRMVYFIRSSDPFYNWNLLSFGHYNDTGLENKTYRY